MDRLPIPFENYHRLDIIQKLIARTNANRYLEIGCDKNQIFKHIRCETKIGVDPARGGTHRMTSDDFFKSYRDKKFQVIFIDGLHHYDQVARDVNNSLEFLEDNGYIVIHDLLPVYEDETSIPYVIKSDKSPYWLGDTWRLSFDLMGRSDLTYKLVATDCGCGIVTKKPQIPFFTPHENTWEWYSNNWFRLPFIKYDEI
jgi:hypothetical protein